jgi:biotin transporter BioY
MQTAAKLTMGVGVIVTLGCMVLALLVPLPESVQWISATMVLLIPIPPAILPIAATVLIVRRFKRVLHVRCQHCQHAETVYIS